jgi:beta-lactamase regulating signal transducer with metallopeptidase domain
MKMSLIVLGALAVSFLSRRRSAALRHWVLAAGIGCAAAMPILTAAVPAWPLPFATPTAFTPYEDPFRDAGSSSSTRPTDTVTGAPVAVRVPPATTLNSRFDLGTALRRIWLAGTFVGLAILLTGVLRLAWLAVHAHRVTHGRWHDLAAEISRGYGLRRPVTLLQSSHPSLLVTWGLAHPKVILPSAADAWTEERARVVLSHELAHIRRGDWIVQLFAELLRAFYWFNPLLWVACRRLRLESEHACDDEVMRRGLDGTDYATHLIELARALNQRRPIWFPAPAMARPSSLERRVRAMLNNRLDRGSISGSTRAAILVVLLAVTTALAAAQSAFVTFAGSIVDEQGRGVQGVAVALVNEARQAKYEVRTNQIGRFEFVGLPAGDYALEAKGNGFQSLKDVLTVAGQNLQRNYTLKLGTLQETITLGFSTADTSSTSSDTVTLGKTFQAKKTECVASPNGGRIVPPKKIRDAHPYYPSSLRGAWTEGVVKLRARIGVDGYVADVSVVGDAQPDLAQSAIAAVREWQYTETLLNCTPVEVMMDVTVNFERRP